MLHDDDQHTPADKPSKSQLKREAQAALTLAKELIGLDQRSFDALSLPPAVAEAAEQAMHIHAHAARKRQLHFLAKQIRRADPDTIRAQLDSLNQRKAMAAQHFHQLEQWRDRLIGEGDDTLEAFIANHPQCDRQRLRQYVRQARQEAAHNKPPRAARALFRYLRELMDDSTRVGSADRE